MSSLEQYSYLAGETAQFLAHFVFVTFPLLAAWMAALAQAAALAS